MDFFVDLLKGGVAALADYLSAHVITCLVPAFFIAGAISAFLSQASVLKYFGPKAKKVVSYSVASVSGAVLAVCSCTVLPLFGGIYKRGAGLGPAITFLYAAPAINVLAIVYSAKLLGYDLGIGRAIMAILFSVVIGIIMAFIYRKEQSKADAKAFEMMAAQGHDGAYHTGEEYADKQPGYDQLSETQRLTEPLFDIDLAEEAPQSHRQYHEQDAHYYPLLPRGEDQYPEQGTDKQ